jgi:hypothetical protein
MYQNLSDKEFLQLVFTSEGRLGIDYVEEAKTRRVVVIPFLCDVLTRESNYRSEDRRFWGVIHAVHILGILGDIKAFEAFISANKLSHKHGIDWIWDVLPECYFRLGKGIIPKLMGHIEAVKSLDYDFYCEEILGLWNLWEGYPEERKRIEDFMLKVINDPSTHPVTQVSLIADLAQLGRKDLKPLFVDYCEGGERNFDLLTRDDLDYFFDSVQCPPTFHYNLEDLEEIEAWRKSSTQKNGPEQEMLVVSRRIIPVLVVQVKSSASVISCGRTRNGLD